MSNLLFSNKLFYGQRFRPSEAEVCPSVTETKNLPPLSRIRLGVVLILCLGGCAAPADRTKQLLELDLAQRHSAIESLQKQQGDASQPWRLYSLGVLYGADGDYEKMNHWFARCQNQSPLYQRDIEFVRLGHWRDEARSGDQAAKSQQWPLAVKYLEQALLAMPEKAETRLRLIEARIMAFGPGLEEIRALVAAQKPEMVYRWLEYCAAADQQDQRLQTRVRLAAQITGIKAQPADALAFYVAGELSRLDGEWPTMDRFYRQAASLDEANRNQNRLMAAARRTEATGLLQESLIRWSYDRVPQALATLDTADLVDPGRADVFQARKNIIALDRARSDSQVAQVLAVGDLDQRWLTFWMARLYQEDRLRAAGMVANELLRFEQSLDSIQKSQALRVRIAFNRSLGNWDQARDDLRDLLNMGEKLPTEAIILGDVLLAQSRYEEARHWFDQAQVWGENSASLLLKEARIAFSQDRIDDMNELALQASDLEPENKEARRILAKAKALGADSEGVR